MNKILTVFLLFPTLSFAQGWDNVNIKTTKVEGNVYYLEGRGGNIGVLVGEDGVLLVDNQFAPLSEKIKAAVKEISDSEISFLVNTHYHGDHTGGNENFKKDDVVIVAHKNVKARMATTFENTVLKRTMEAKSESFWPNMSIPMDKLGLSLFGENVDLIHVPGCHTDGDMIVHFKKANVLHTGDAFVRYGYPYIDISAGGTIDGFIAAQEKILSLINPETKIIPGHGQLSSKKDVEELLAMLKETRAIVANAKEAGTSLEDLIPQEPLKAYHEKWSGNFINSDLFVQTIYESL